MAVESASFINQLDVTNPRGTDQRSTLDDHARIVKSAVRNTLPNMNATMSATPTALNLTNGLTANAQLQLNALDSARQAQSAALNSEVASVSAALQASLLGLSATAANSILWDGSVKYTQTATPAMSDGDIWFEPE